MFLNNNLTIVEFEKKQNALFIYSTELKSSCMSQNIYWLVKNDQDKFHTVYGCEKLPGYAKLAVYANLFFYSCCRSCFCQEQFAKFGRYSFAKKKKKTNKQTRVHTFSQLSYFSELRNFLI